MPCRQVTMPLRAFVETLLMWPWRVKINLTSPCLISCCQFWQLCSPHAMSAGAVTGRQCPHSGVGEDFLMRRPFLGNVKSIQRWQIDRLAEGYKHGIDEIQCPIAKTGLLGRNKNFRPKKHQLLCRNPVLATTRLNCAKKKVPFSQINISILANFGCFFGKKADFLPKKTIFGQA